MLTNTVGTVVLGWTFVCFQGLSLVIGAMGLGMCNLTLITLYQAASTSTVCHIMDKQK